METLCETYGYCDMEEYLHSRKCSKCGRTSPKTKPAQDIKNIPCEVYGTCDMEEYLNRYKCSKCGYTVGKI